MASVVAYTGLIPQVIEYQESAGTQTFEDGDLVLLHTDGKIRIASAGNMFGIARRDAESAEGTLIPVELLNPNEIYVMVSDGSSNLDQLGLTVDISDFTEGAMLIDETDTAGDSEVTIVQLHPADASGTASGRLLVKFNTYALEARA